MKTRKTTKNAEIEVVWGIKDPQGHRQHNYSIERMRLSIRLNRNYAFILYRFRVVVSYLSKVSYFDLPHLHFSPPLAVTKHCATL